MSGTRAGSAASPFRQPKAVFAVAFACVVSRAVVRNHLDRLAAHHVPAEGQILLHAADHGAAGRMVAEYASTIGARTIVISAPSHGGLSALMDGSASRELWRHARSNVLIVNPDAPGTLSVRPVDRSADAELLRG